MTHDPGAPITTRSTAAARGLPVWADWVQAATRVLWLYAVPALLAGVAMKYLIPEIATGPASPVVSAARAVPVLTLTALFVVFSLLAHYWRYHLPGGRYALSIAADVASGERDPAVLREWEQLSDTAKILSSPSLRRRLTASLGQAGAAETEKHVEALRAAIQAGALAAARAAAAAATATTVSAIRGRAWMRRVWSAALVLTAMGVVVVVRWTLAEPYEVVSSSMLPTLVPGDRLVANKRAYRGSKDGQELPSRGDLIVFPSRAVALGPGTWPTTLVKRVIGVPGDRIEWGRDGAPVINGWTVPSCKIGRYVHMMETTPPDSDPVLLDGRVLMEFLGSEAYLTVRTVTMPRLTTFVVPPGEVFVLGDNRANSLDSRSWNRGRGGGVPIAAIDGRAQWFLLRSDPAGGADFGRLFRRLGSVDGELRGGSVASSFQEGVMKCLRDRPSVTTPPALSTAANPGAGKGPGT